MKNKTDAIQKSEFTSPTLVVRITETYRPGMTTAQICDCARWAWDADLGRASNCKLVLAVYKGEVLGALEPSKCDFAANIKPPKGKAANLVAKDIKEGLVAFEGVDVSHRHLLGVESLWGRIQLNMRVKLPASTGLRR